MIALPPKLSAQWQEMDSHHRMRFWRMVAIILLSVSAVWLMGRSASLTHGDYIGRISVEGIIFDDQKRNQSLSRLSKDHALKALIVHLNTPGGSAVGGESLYHHLRALSQHKKVVIVMHEVAASAGYMAALGGSHIIAREQTITGSIGALFQMANIEQLLASLGISMELFKSGALKATPNPYEKVSPEAARHVMETHINQTREFFLNLVVERRQLSSSERDLLAQGQTLSGRQALDMNLIDEIGGEMEAITWLEKDAALIDLPVRDIHYGNRWQQLFQGRNATFENWTNSLTQLFNFLLFAPLLSLWTPSLD